MDRKTEYDLAKTVLMLERMGLKAAAQKLEEADLGGGSIVGLSVHELYKLGMEDAKAGQQMNPMEDFDSMEDYQAYKDGYEDASGGEAMEEADKPDFLDLDKDGDKEESMKKAAKDKEAKNEEKGIFAPNHYCVHHGGVQHNGAIAMAEAVGHNWNEELGRVTHYDMKLEDGTVLEGIAFEDIQVTNASLANEHMHSMGAHSDDEEEEELDEILGDDTGRSDLGGNPDKKDKKEKEDKKDESVSLKGMTKAELTEAIKEIIKQKLNK
jgi:hypothetical protein